MSAPFNQGCRGGYSSERLSRLNCYHVLKYRVPLSILTVGCLYRPLSPSPRTLFTPRYPFLVGKHFHEFGVLDTTCQPYAGNDREACVQGCLPDPDPTRRGPHAHAIYGGDYGYVGGYYGACNADAMMREIRKVMYRIFID